MQKEFAIGWLNKSRYHMEACWFSSSIRAEKSEYFLGRDVDTNIAAGTELVVLFAEVDSFKHKALPDEDFLTYF